MTHSAEIVEIFSSIQGEGTHAGEPMTFVRFGGCSLRCNFCDTPQGLQYSDSCRVESPPRSSLFNEVENPIGAAALCDLLSAFDDKTISITGGEPLEQAEFLAQWLPSEAQRRRILLETNGIHSDALTLVLPFIHIISMDMKLPSSSRKRPFWNEHAQFIQRAVASGRELYVKVVITDETTDRDIQKAIDILGRANKYIPLILQPASQTLTFHGGLSDERLQSAERLCTAFLPDVRVMPQMHKEWGVQ